MSGDLREVPTPDELKAARRLARALEEGATGGAEAADELGVARLLEVLRHDSQGTSGTELRAELVRGRGRAAWHWRLAAALALVAILAGLLEARRSSRSHALAERELAARRAVARLEQPASGRPPRTLGTIDRELTAERQRQLFTRLARDRWAGLQGGDS